MVPLSGLNGLLPQGNPAPQIAPSPNPEIATNATASAASEPAEAGATAEDASPVPVAGTGSADEVAAEWVARWNAGDYAGMYALASGTVRRTIPLEEFASRYQGIVDRAELHSMQAEITGAAGDTPRVPFRVRFESGIAGEFSEENTLPWCMRRTDGEWPGHLRPSLPSSGPTAVSTSTDYPPDGAGSSIGTASHLPMTGRCSALGSCRG